MKQGECPKCHGYDLEYDSMELVDEEVYYPFRCRTCGTTAKEWYGLTYLETEIEGV